MKLGRCPICHSHIDLVSLVQDEAGRELLGVLAKVDTLVGTALIGYLSLFRSNTRDLANDRALRLYKECDDIAQGDWQRLATVMHIQIEQVRTKVDAGERKQQFKNHNYLKKVIEDVPTTKRASVIQSGQALTIQKITGKDIVKPSKTANALSALESMKEHE